jgi:hypothetical protein
VPPFRQSTDPLFIENNKKRGDKYRRRRRRRMTTQPITVLIEQPDFVPFASPLRRSSLTPGLSHHHGSTHGHGGGGFTQYGGGGGSPQNSIHSISGAGGSTVDIPSTSASSSTTMTTTRQANRNSMSATGTGNQTTKEWNRRQRTSTTFHASIDVPDSLLAALSSITIGEFSISNRAKIAS